MTHDAIFYIYSHQTCLLVKDLKYGTPNILKYDLSSDRGVSTVTRLHVGQQKSHNMIPIRGKTSSPSPRHPD